MTRFSFFSFFLQGAISARLLPYAFLTLRPPQVSPFPAHLVLRKSQWPGSWRSLVLGQLGSMASN